jgi:hypothetical protein
MTRVRQHSRMSFIDIVARLWAAVQIAVLLSCFVPPAIAEEVAPVAPPQAIKVIPEASDAKIEERLQRILNSTGWFDATRVSVRDGVVFLDGTTETRSIGPGQGRSRKKPKVL